MGRRSASPSTSSQSSLRTQGYGGCTDPTPHLAEEALMANRFAIMLLSMPSILAALPAQSQPAPVNNWVKFRAAMAPCWTVPLGTEGSLIAYRFGLAKAGAIRGKPLTTARRLVGDHDAQQRYEEAASA